MGTQKQNEGMSRFISTNLRPATDTGHLLLRKRLLDKLNQGADRRLTVIHAPVGFGETAIAMQWRKFLMSSGAKVVWLSVDSEDNEQERCLMYFIEAIRLVEPAIAPDAVSARESKSNQAIHYVATDLLNDIALCSPIPCHGASP